MGEVHHTRVLSYSSVGEWKTMACSAASVRAHAQASVSGRPLRAAQWWLEGILAIAGGSEAIAEKMQHGEETPPS